jgi:hypothetical protein
MPLLGSGGEMMLLLTSDKRKIVGELPTSKIPRIQSYHRSFAGGVA